MTYKDDFETLLDIAEQSLEGIDFDKRTVLGFAGLFVLKQAVENYRNKQANNKSSEPNRVDVEYIEWLLDERAKINNMDLEKIEFFENGKRLNIPKEIARDFDLTGLSNVDFISSGYYKGEF